MRWAGIYGRQHRESPVQRSVSPVTEVGGSSPRMRTKASSPPRSPRRFGEGKSEQMEGLISQRVYVGVFSEQLGQCFYPFSDPG